MILLGVLCLVSSTFVYETNFCVLQDYEERQLRWEHREVELERQIAALESQTAQIAGAAAQVSDWRPNVCLSKLHNSNKPNLLSIPPLLRH